MSPGKKRVWAPGEPPGYGATHPGKAARRERREGPRPSRDVRQPAQTPWRRDTRGRWEGRGLAREPVGAKTGGSCYPKDQGWDSWEVTPQQGEGALGQDVRDGHHPRTQRLSRVDNGSALTSGVANRVVRGAGEPALQPPSQWEGRAGSVMVANRTRESRPSGMTWGACGHVDNGGTRHPPRLSKERVLVTLCLKSRAPQFYPDSSC